MKKFVMIAAMAFSLTGCATLSDLNDSSLTDQHILDFCGQATTAANQGKVVKEFFLSCTKAEFAKRDRALVNLGLPTTGEASQQKAEKAFELMEHEKKLQDKKDKEEKQKRDAEEKAIARKQKQEMCILATETRWRELVYQAQVTGDRQEVLRLTDPAFKRNVLNYCLNLK